MLLKCFNGPIKYGHAEKSTDTNRLSSQGIVKTSKPLHWSELPIPTFSLITQTLKTFFYNVLVVLGGLTHVLPLAVHLE